MEYPISAMPAIIMIIPGVHWYWISKTPAMKRKHKEIWNEFRKDYIKPEEISLAWIARAFTAILGYISFIIFPVRHHPD